MKTNLEIEEDFKTSEWFEDAEVKDRRHLLPPSPLFGLPTCPSLSCHAQLPAIGPLRLTARVGAIKSRSTCKLITNM